jgi:hypothetical protein
VRYEYDQLGRIAISHIESELENVSYKWIYNAIGQLEEKVAFRPTTSFQYKLEYSYDSLGNQVEYRGTMADGTAYQGTSRKVYSYENGKKRSTQCYNGVNFDTKGYLIMHLYDDEGKEILNYIFKEPNSDQADTSYVYYEYYE